MITLAEYRNQPYFGCWLDEKYDDWLVFLSHSRDSDLLTESNWSSALKALGGESHGVMIVRFGHWLCGWIEHILINPLSRYAEIARDIERALDYYPVLDDMDYSERESNCYLESWNDYGAQQYRRNLVSGYGLAPSTENFIDDIDDDALRELYAAHCSEEYHAESSGVYISCSAGNLTRDELAEFLIRQRHQKLGTNRQSETARLQKRLEFEA